MLVLMSIHDLMKLDKLRPTCSVKDFNGYKKGEQILGHHSETKSRSKFYTTSRLKLRGEWQRDMITFTYCLFIYVYTLDKKGEANEQGRFKMWNLTGRIFWTHQGSGIMTLLWVSRLRATSQRLFWRLVWRLSGYVLEHFQKALPSFAGLSKSQQDSIRFTHCHLADQETVNLSKMQHKVHEVPIPLRSRNMFVSKVGSLLLTQFGFCLFDTQFIFYICIASLYISVAIIVWI